MMPRNRISIVLTAFNASDTLISSLDSILTQSQIPDEVILIDDCSQDNTLQIASKWSSCQDLTRVRLLRNKVNLGPAASRNLGVRESSHNTIIFCDSDDVMYPDRVKMQATVLENHALSYVSTIKVYSNGYQTSHINKPFSGPISLHLGIESWLLGNSNELQSFVPSCALGVRKDDFITLGGFDESFNRLEDVDLALRASMKNLQFHFDETILVKRSSTDGAYKSRQVEALSQNKILNKYSKYLDVSKYREIRAWQEVRTAYFSREWVSLVFKVVKYIFFSGFQKERIKAAIRRIKHDRNIDRR